MDISPTTKEGIVDINIHEESHVEEILRELLQRFGERESSESLKRYLIDRLVEKANQHQVLFCEFNYPIGQKGNISVEHGLEKLFECEVWLIDNQPKLHVYSPKLNRVKTGI